MTRKSVCSSVSALIHDDDTGCASGPSVLDFGLECAGPATDQRHKAAFEFIEVGGFAAAGRSEWRVPRKAEPSPHAVAPYHCSNRIWLRSEKRRQTLAPAARQGSAQAGPAALAPRRRGTRILQSERDSPPLSTSPPHTLRNDRSRGC